MKVNSVGAVIGCTIGAIIAFTLVGTITIIPFIIALILYNLAEKPRPKAKMI